MTYTLREINDLNDRERSRYSALTKDDKCYYLTLYPHHELIWDLKPSFPLTPHDKGKQDEAVKECARLLIHMKGRRGGLEKFAEKEGNVIVPIPPHKIKGNREYDDRLIKILSKVKKDTDWPIDIRELVLQKKNMRSSSQSSQSGDNRLRKEDLIENYQINEDESYKKPNPVSAIIFDDVLTTGNHYKAMEYVIKERFPDIKTYGLFIARVPKD